MKNWTFSKKNGNFVSDTPLPIVVGAGVKTEQEKNEL